MTNVERNRNAQEMLFTRYGNMATILSSSEDLKCSLLLDISVSLASIADSLERLPPREENVRIGTDV